MVFSAPPAKIEHSIEKAEIQWPSTKHQMTISALVIVASCLICYGSTLKMGFLLDDYLHLDYAARALTGEIAPLINNFISNWGGSDIMKSYRPVVSLSIFIDYILYHIHAFGFHLTNLIIFCLCSIMVALVTLELTGRLGSRSGALAALWAGLLFSVYPLHAESVAWIIGRVDTLATAFYLASIYCFLRLELLKEKVYLLRSLIFFVLALASKETAVSLPVAIAFLALLPPSVLVRAEAKSAAGEDLLPAAIDRCKHSFWAVLPYGLTLIAFALLRQTLIGTTIGGYGPGGGGMGDLLHSLKIFADRDSLTKIFVPVSEEYLPVRTLAPYCLGPIIALALLFLSRQLIQIIRGKQTLASYFVSILPPLFSILWLALALVPAFQIWHIYPNLVGSRLFFLSSAGLCIALALLGLPVLEKAMTSRNFAFFAVPALLVLSTLYLVWFYALQTNLAAWQKASELTIAFEAQLRETVLTSKEKTIFVLNLPQDYKGAGMLGRKLYLDILNRPPFLGMDLSKRLAVLEPKITGSKDYIWPDELAAAERIGENNIFIWSNQDGKLRPFTPLKNIEGQKNNWGDDLIETLKSLPTIKADRWQTVSPGQPLLRSIDSNWVELSLAPGSNESRNQSEVTLWLPQFVNPGLAANQFLSLLVKDEDDTGLTAKYQALWRTKNTAEQSMSEENILGKAYGYIDSNHSKNCIFALARFRSFRLSAKPLQLGLRFNLAQGPLRFQPKSLRFLTGRDLFPVISLDKKNESLAWDISSINKSENIAGEQTAKSFDQLRFFVINTIDPNTELDIYQPAVIEKITPDLILPFPPGIEKGNIDLASLSKNLAFARQKSKSGVTIYQITAVAANKKGSSRSLCSPPVTLVIEGKP